MKSSRRQTEIVIGWMFEIEIEIGKTTEIPKAKRMVFAFVSRSIVRPMELLGLVSKL